jgi:hypothetical protein
MQGVFEQAHVFVQCAEEGFNLSGNVNSTSHSDGRASCGENVLADGWFLFEETPNTLAQPLVRVKLRPRDNSLPGQLRRRFRGYRFSRYTQTKNAAAAEAMAMSVITPRA